MFCLIVIGSALTWICLLPEHLKPLEDLNSKSSNQFSLSIATGVLITCGFSSTFSNSSSSAMYVYLVQQILILPSQLITTCQSTNCLRSRIKFALTHALFFHINKLKLNPTFFKETFCFLCIITLLCSKNLYIQIISPCPSPYVSFCKADIPGPHSVILSFRTNDQFHAGKSAPSIQTVSGAVFSS